MTLTASEYLTVDEVCGLLRLSQSGVYKALRQGRIDGIQPLGPGGPWRIPREQFKVAPIHRQTSDPMPRRRRGGRFREKVVELESRRSA